MRPKNIVKKREIQPVNSYEYKEVAESLMTCNSDIKILLHGVDPKDCLNVDIIPFSCITNRCTITPIIDRDDVNDTCTIQLKIETKNFNNRYGFNVEFSKTISPPRAIILSHKYENCLNSKNFEEKKYEFSEKLELSKHEKVMYVKISRIWKNL